MVKTEKNQNRDTTSNNLLQVLLSINNTLCLDLLPKALLKTSWDILESRV